VATWNFSEKMPVIFRAGSYKLANYDFDDDGVTSAAETRRRLGPDSQEIAKYPSEDEVGK